MRGDHEGALRGHDGHEEGGGHEGGSFSHDRRGDASMGGGAYRAWEAWSDEASCASWSLARVSSPLLPEAEEAMTRVIGCAIAVHRALGPGFIEPIYRKALCIECAARGLPFEAERSVRVVYRGVDIPGQRIDLIVMGQVVVELKCVTQFHRVHVAQVISYLKTLGLRGGLLINFQVPVLRLGLKRIVV